MLYVKIKLRVLISKHWMTYTNGKLSWKKNVFIYVSKNQTGKGLVSVFQLTKCITLINRDVKKNLLPVDYARILR